MSEDRSRTEKSGTSGGSGKSVESVGSDQSEDIQEIIDAEHGLVHYLGWNREDVKEFQAVWEKMKERSVDGLTSLGAAILIWVIENVPDAKKLFHVFDKRKSYKGGASMVNEKFMQHAIGITQTLEKIINSLDDSTIALHHIRKLAKMHVQNAVIKKQFEDLRDLFHLFLYDLIRAQKHSRAATLWYQFFDTFIEFYAEEDAKVATHKKKALCCGVF